MHKGCPPLALSMPAADCTPALDVAAVQQQFRSDSPQVFQALEEAKQGKSEAAGEAPVPACVSIAGREELEVTFLGTGAAVPSKYRNVTSIFVNLFDKGCLLMDAGGCRGEFGVGVGRETSAGLARVALRISRDSQ